jgi:hypothetical protein
MFAARKTLLALIGLAAASAACRPSPSEENIALGNEAATPTDIEALPPDESVATPANELNVGDDEPANADQPTHTN